MVVDCYAPLLPDDLLRTVVSFVFPSALLQTEKQHHCQPVAFSTPKVMSKKTREKVLYYLYKMSVLSSGVDL